MAAFYRMYSFTVEQFLSMEGAAAIAHHAAIWAKRS